MSSEILAQNVRRLRVVRGISQQGLADASGISLYAIKNIELAKGISRVNTIRKIAKALNARLRDLFIPIRKLHAVRFRLVKNAETGKCS
jgi:transcriptional regulator with XRE-family HTH domain